jgi:hypothetical protein
MYHNIYSLHDLAQQPQSLSLSPPSENHRDGCTAAKIVRSYLLLQIDFIECSLRRHIA